MTSELPEASPGDEERHEDIGLFGGSHHIPGTRAEHIELNRRCHRVVERAKVFEDKMLAMLSDECEAKLSSLKAENATISKVAWVEYILFIYTLCIIIGRVLSKAMIILLKTESTKMTQDEFGFDNVLPKISGVTKPYWLKLMIFDRIEKDLDDGINNYNGKYSDEKDFIAISKCGSITQSIIERKGLKTTNL